MTTTTTTKSELDRKREQIRYLRHRISRDRADIRTRELALERAVSEYNDMLTRSGNIPDRADAHFPFIHSLYRLPHPGIQRPKNQRTTLLLLREGRYSDAAKHYRPHPQYPTLNRLVADASNQQ